MSEIQIKDQKKSGMAWRFIIILLFALMVIAILFIFDTPIWQAARDLVEPDYLYLPELFTHWGVYLFYLIFGAILSYAFIKKNRKLVKIGLAYIKAQVVFPGCGQTIKGSTGPCPARLRPGIRFF